MNKKRFATAFLVIILILAMSPAVAFAKGKPPVETNNNLSFPVIWSEGISLNLAGNMLEASLTVPYSIDPNPCGEGAFAYAQKTIGNVWQAENVAITDLVVDVDEIDWGDSLESVDMKVGRPVRVELSLYKTLATQMTGFTMVMLANPSSPDEVQGACATTNPGTYETAITYLSSEATVYSPHGKLVIQKISGANLTWVDNQWIGEDAGTPINVSFAGELNVGGKVIYGLSTGGWKPTELGDYRITFYLPTDKNTKFDDNTTIRLSTETEAVVTAEEGGDVGGEAFVIPEHNLTYIDITVVGGGGGGKK